MNNHQSSIPITARDGFFSDPFFNPFWEFVERRLQLIGSPFNNQPRDLPRFRHLLSEADNVLNSWDTITHSFDSDSSRKLDSLLRRPPQEVPSMGERPKPVVKDIKIEREPESPPVITELLSKQDSIDSISTTAELGSMRRFDVFTPPVISETETPRDAPSTPFSTKNIHGSVLIQDVTTPKVTSRTESEPSYRKNFSSKYETESNVSTTSTSSIPPYSLKPSPSPFYTPKTSPAASSTPTPRTMTPDPSSTPTPRTMTPVASSTPTPRTMTPVPLSTPTPRTMTSLSDITTTSTLTNSCTSTTKSDLRHVPIQMGYDPVLSNRFQVILDMNQYLPEEVTVKVTKKWVLVEAEHSETMDHDNYMNRKYVRKFGVPLGVESGKISASLSADRILTIDAPRKVPELSSTKEVVIPITRTGVNVLAK